NGPRYPFPDMLGSVRAVTNNSGSVIECYDYLPFGRIFPAGGADARPSCYPSNPDYPFSSSVSQKFTAKERDAETGLDYFGSRYYSGAQGRFSSPDRPFADQHPEDPQSCNLYEYVRANPLA